MSDIAGSSSSLPGRFDVVKYRPDGGISIGDALQLVGYLGFVGMITGAVAGFIAKYFWLILLFPVLIGGVLGGVGAWLVRRMRVRNPIACGMAGFLAGSLAMFNMHYVEYRTLRSAVDQRVGDNADGLRQIAHNLDQFAAPDVQQPDDLKEVVQALQQNPEFVKVLKIDSVWKYIDHMAEQGVELKKAGAGGKGMNLGYYGSYIYWIIEALIVAGMAYAIMAGTAAEPYCTECHQWKYAEEWGPVDSAPQVSASLQEGTIVSFPSGATGSAPIALLKIHRCPNCGDAGTVDIQVDEVSVNKKGEVQRKKLAFVTFPGAALAALQAACGRAPVETPNETEDPASPTA